MGLVWMQGSNKPRKSFAKNDRNSRSTTWVTHFDTGSRLAWFMRLLSFGCYTQEQSHAPWDLGLSSQSVRRFSSVQAGMGSNRRQQSIMSWWWERAAMCAWPIHFGPSQSSLHVYHTNFSQACNKARVNLVLSPTRMQKLGWSGCARLLHRS